MTSPTSAPYLIEQRLERLRRLLPELGVEGMLIMNGPNRAYLSGFTGSAGALLITASAALLATDSRYYEQVARQAPAFELVKITRQLKDVLAEMLQRTGVARLGFEADDVTVATLESLKEAAPDLQWQATQKVVAGLRAIKDAAEVAVLRRAIALTDEALAAALRDAEPGITEQQLAWSIESHMRTHGAHAVAFELIVAGGPNSALPHAHPSDAPLLAGEPIVIDIGAEIDGYHADLTRTVCFGQPNDPDRFWKVYNTVLAAQAAAEAGIRPGMPGKVADALARDVIAAAGYGDNFGHGLGHGVGLDIHEAFRLSPYATDVVQPGMAITIEPGIYLPGWGGVRIEDIVLITENGAEVLSGAPKGPIL